jgi:hypothetical protein
MYCDSTPSGKRMNAPAKVGTETIKPVCAADSLNASDMNGPMAPFNTQTANEKSKYRKAASKVGGCPDFRNSFALAIKSLLGLDWKVSN